MSFEIGETVTLRGHKTRARITRLYTKSDASQGQLVELDRSLRGWRTCKNVWEPHELEHVFRRNP